MEALEHRRLLADVIPPVVLSTSLETTGIVEGISMTDITVTHPETEARPTFFFDDVRGIRLRGVYSPSSKLTFDRVIWHLIAHLG